MPSQRIPLSILSDLYLSRSKWINFHAGLYINLHEVGWQILPWKKTLLSGGKPESPQVVRTPPEVPQHSQLTSPSDALPLAPYLPHKCHQIVDPHFTDEKTKSGNSKVLSWLLSVIVGWNPGLWLQFQCTFLFWFGGTHLWWLIAHCLGHTAFQSQQKYTLA